MVSRMKKSFLFLLVITVLASIGSCKSKSSESIVNSSSSEVKYDNLTKENLWRYIEYSSVYDNVSKGSSTIIDMSFIGVLHLAFYDNVKVKLDLAYYQDDEEESKHIYYVFYLDASGSGSITIDANGEFKTLQKCEVKGEIEPLTSYYRKINIDSVSGRVFFPR